MANSQDFATFLTLHLDVSMDLPPLEIESGYALASHNRCHNRYRLFESSVPLCIGIIGKKQYRYSSSPWCQKGWTALLKGQHNIKALAQNKLNHCLRYAAGSRGVLIKLMT